MHFFSKLFSLVGLAIGVIALVIFGLSFIPVVEVQIQSMTAVIWFAAGVFIWIIPLQVIDALKMVRVQRRIRRIIYPYLVNAIQVGAFVYYVVQLESRVSGIVFSGIGLVLFAFAIVLISRAVYSWISGRVASELGPRMRVQ